VTLMDKYTLVSPEVARLERRELDAMRLYDQAIQTAHDNGFAQNEGIANEVGGDSTSRSVLRRPAITISGTRATAIWVGGLTPRLISWTNCTLDSEARPHRC
jgi:hypothetical protein